MARADVDTEFGTLPAAPYRRRIIADDSVDDDGKPKRTGTVWTASAHVITAVIGSGVLSLPWSTAQLGWVAGPVTLFVFAVITYYTSVLLTDCYRTDDAVTGKRNYTYMEAVESYLGGWQVWFCGLCQYVNLVGTAIGYTITASISAAALYKANCFHDKGHAADCSVYTTMYMVVFGISQIFFSQLPNLSEMAWLSILAAVMSFAYATIGVGLSLAQTISGPTGKTTMGGTQIGVDVNSAAQKTWLTLQALGNIAFAYSYSMVLIEIQDTVRAPPAENKTMRKANLMGVSTTTAFYMLCGCLGYAAFGNAAPGNMLTGFGFGFYEPFWLIVSTTTAFYMLCGCLGYAAFGNAAPGNMLTGFGFYEPYWLIDFANVCIVVHLVGAYQVYCQPIYAAVENWAAKRWPGSDFVVRNYPVAGGKFNFNMFRLVWRTAFVVVSTVLAISLPFFNDILGLLGALGFWPLTVYFPVEMYLRQSKVKKFSKKWVALQSLSFACFVVTVAVTVASVQGITQSLKNYVPFKTKL